MAQSFIPNKWSYLQFEEKIWTRGEEINEVSNNFLRLVLGVNKTTPNIGIIGETGKYPIILKAYIQIMKYWVRLISVESKYMQNAHISNLQQLVRGKNNWCKIINYLLIYTDMKNNLNIQDILLKPIKFIKPKFYQTMKKNYYYEKYLDILHKDEREAVSRFRLSDHHLPI